MYQILEMREGSGSSVVLEKAIWGSRRTGRESGGLASSMPEASVVKGGSSPLGGCSAVGAPGWLMAFWPVMVVPSARPAEM